MNTAPGLTWVQEHAAAIAADVHHRHGLDWYDMPAHVGLHLAEMLLQTPGTYTHSTVLTSRALETVAATPAPRPDPRPSTGTPGAIRASEGEHVHHGAVGWTDKQRELARLNGLAPGG